MLHEVLLLLVVGESDLFEGEDELLLKPLPHVHPGEREQLNRLAQTAALHMRVRSRAAQLLESRDALTSALAHAVTHELQDFVGAVAGVETRIVHHDALLVGSATSHSGGGLVSLASLIAELDVWHHKLIFLDSTTANASISTGTDAMAELHTKSLAGWSSTRELAARLLAELEAAWLNEVREKLVYGIQHDWSWPSYLDREAARADEAIFVASAIQNLRAHKPAVLTTAAYTRMVVTHSQVFSKLSPPLREAELADVFHVIRQSFYDNVLHELLPLEHVIAYLRVIRRVYMCESEDFVTRLLDGPSSAVEHALYEQEQVLTTEGAIDECLAFQKLFSITNSLGSSRFMSRIVGYEFRVDMHLDWPLSAVFSTPSMTRVQHVFETVFILRVLVYTVAQTFVGRRGAGAVPRKFWVDISFVYRHLVVLQAHFYTRIIESSLQQAVVVPNSGDPIFSMARSFAERAEYMETNTFSRDTSFGELLAMLLGSVRGMVAGSDSSATLEHLALVTKFLSASSHDDSVDQRPLNQLISDLSSLCESPD